MNNPDKNNPATVTYKLPDALTLTYVGEGAANVVYRIDVHPQLPPIILPGLKGTSAAQRALSSWNRHSEAATHLSNKLLRLRKDLPTTAPTEVSHQNWLRLFCPLFKPEELVEQQLVALNNRSLIKALNANLLQHKLSYSTVTSNPSPERDFSRGHSRHGTYLADDEYGLLITDMTPSRTEAQKEKLIEFKPKWLTQSPNAPPHSRRCRTCALNARKKARMKQKTGEQPANIGPDFCPLRLVLDHKDSRVRRGNYRDFWTMLMQRELDPVVLEKLCEWLEVNGIFRYLARLQERFDGEGVLALDEGEGEDGIGVREDGEAENPKKKIEDLQVAMTLRDCSFYMRFDGEDNLLEMRIGDLDFKSVDKVREWRKKEKELRDEGWYLSLERDVGGKGGVGIEVGGQADFCLLSSGVWSGVDGNGDWNSDGGRSRGGDRDGEYRSFSPMGEFSKLRGSRRRRRSWGGSTEVEFRRAVERGRGEEGETSRGLMGLGRWERRNSLGGRLYNDSDSSGIVF